MKILKKILSLVSAAVVMLSVNAVQVYAENPDKVVDGADILTDKQEDDLETYIKNIIKKHSSKYDIAVVTTYGTNGQSIEAFTDDYYDYNGYGYGSDSSGIMIAIDMAERRYHMSTCGQGITVFTDRGLENIEDSILSYLSSGDYYTAFYNFAKRSDDLIDYYESEGYAYDLNIRPRHYGLYFCISLAIGLIVAMTVCMSMKAQLKSVNMQTQAASYIRQGSFRITGEKDMFLYNTVTKTRVSSSSGSSGGRGSTTHSSSSGRSHGGRSGRF